MITSFLTALIMIGLSTVMVISSRVLVGSSLLSISVDDLNISNNKVAIFSLILVLGSSTGGVSNVVTKVSSFSIVLSGTLSLSLILIDPGSKMI